MSSAHEVQQYTRPGAPLDHFRRIVAGLALALALVATPACTTTPITGRASLNLLSIDDDKQLGAQAYGDLLADATFITSGQQHAMVQAVVDRLVAVVEQDPEFTGDLDWEVRLVKDDAVANAWCLPGGKMAVYTGILPYTQDATGLAVVMGHEIGHAVARHGTERMSQQMGLQVILEYAAGEYGANAGEVGAAIAQYAVFLPWGRRQELEADHIGLIYMARAGYDPGAAVGFWQRMGSGGGDSSAIEDFLSTHPSHKERIEQIQEILPEARRAYQRSGPGR